MSNQYTNHVGVKFYKDGSVRPFPGNSVVCMLQDNQKLMDHLEHVANILKKQPFAKRYAFLPPESYHMTLIEGVCDQVRDATHWASKLPLSASLEEMNRFFYDCVQNLKPLEQDVAKAALAYHDLVYNGFLLLRLKCTNNLSENYLRTYRDHFADATGLRFESHESYQFHISLGYQLQYFEEKEKEDITRIIAETDNYLKTHLPEITSLQPILSHFPDMASFPTYMPD